MLPSVVSMKSSPGSGLAELCREHGMSDASFYKWRAKYGGMDASIVGQMKAMEEENRRLKRMYADLSMQNDLLNRLLKKSALKDVILPPRFEGGSLRLRTPGRV